MQLDAVLTGEAQLSQHVMLACVHQIVQLGPARAQLIEHLAPCFTGMGVVGLVESLPDRGGDDDVLAARNMRESVPDPVDAASLPFGDGLTLEHAGDGGL